MGLDPRIFGPSFWGALHLACFRPDNPDKVKQFIDLYQYVLPCPGCRAHFSEVLVEYPPPDDPEELFNWSVEVHNIVNVRLGKPTWTPDEAITEWNDKKVDQILRAENPPEFPYIPAVIGLFLIILAIIILKLRK
jgi:hypothetical protein